MKLVYLTFAIAILLFSGYMLLNDFNFDNTSFSNYLISALVILLTSCIAAGVLAWLFSARKKNNDKGVMTIREYYNYKSAR